MYEPEPSMWVSTLLGLVMFFSIRPTHVGHSAQYNPRSKAFDEIQPLRLILSFQTMFQFHSLPVLNKCCTEHECAADTFFKPLCEHACRWVIDRVYTLNIASVGLHFLHFLCLKMKITKNGLWQQLTHTHNGWTGVTERYLQVQIWTWSCQVDDNTCKTSLS